jgi:hypothetical protein
MACGLFTIASLGQRWAEMSQAELPRLITRQDKAPGDWLAHVRHHVLAQPPQQQEWAALKDKVADPDDTHPSTGERIRALGVSGDEVVRACRLPEQVAGAAWFTDWAAVQARFNATWQSLNARSWRQEHIRRRVQLQRLEVLRSADDRSLARAQLELEYGEPATVVELARPCLADPATSGEAGFLMGAAQLKLGEPQGVGTLEACIKAAPQWALPAREWLARHPALLGGEAQQGRNATLIERAQRKRGRALGLAFEAMQQGRIAPACLNADSWAILREVFAGMPTVAAAWCAGIDGLEHDGRRFDVVMLVLRLRTEQLNELGLTEDELRAEAQSLLHGLLPGAVLRLAWTLYTTEALSPELDARLSDWARRGEPCCLVAPRAGEAVGPGARAAALG